MRKARFNYGKLAAVSVAVAIALTQSVSASRSTNPASRSAAFDQVDLSGEARTIDSFNDDFANYNKTGIELSKKSTLTNEEFNSLERTGNDLKRRVSQLRDGVQSIIRKLKAAGRWNTLDEELLAKVKDANDRAFVQKQGGLRRIFEDAVTQLDSQAADDIVAPLSHLRPKVAAQNKEFRFDDSQAMSWRMVTAGYSPSAYVPLADRRSARCIGATIRYATRLVVSGYENIPPNFTSNMHCYCDGGPQCRPGDGSIMVW